MGKWRDYLEPGDEPSIADTPEPEPDVPPAIGVMFGAQPGWSPERENQHPASCRICGLGCGGPIKAGSRIVCMGCGRYGLDRQIDAILAENPPPKPDPSAAPETVTLSAGLPAPIRVGKGPITVPDRFRDQLAKE